MHHEYVERVVNLIKPDSHRIYNMSVQEAEQRILSGDPNGVEGIDGSFALLAKEGKPFAWQGPWIAPCVTSWPNVKRVLR